MSRPIGEVPTRTFQPGDVIFREGDDAKGEGVQEALLAADAVTLMVIPANRLDHLVRANPALAVALIRDLAKGMLAAEDRLRDVEDKQTKK